ncbi:MAG: peptide-methionine (S)-S-oxide reductase MsrA [Pseudomonadota bacterium]
MANQQSVILAGGCFWCTEAVFLPLKGIGRVESGYIGGEESTANYDAVCSGRTGHAEAIRVTFDPDIISLAQIYDIFFATHDPTQLNRQGNDIGTQYRSALFPFDGAQKAEADAAIGRANEIWDGKVVTTIEPDAPFYVAEGYHQNYFARNPGNPYCLAVAAPKVAKVRQSYGALLKDA